MELLLDPGMRTLDDLSSCVICLEDMSASIGDETNISDLTLSGNESVQCSHCKKNTHIECLSIWLNKHRLEDLCPHCRVHVSDMFVLRVHTIARGEEAALAIHHRKEQEHEERRRLRGIFRNDWERAMYYGGYYHHHHHHHHQYHQDSPEDEYPGDESEGNHSNDQAEYWSDIEHREDDDNGDHDGSSRRSDDGAGADDDGPSLQSDQDEDEDADSGVGLRGTDPDQGPGSSRDDPMILD